MNALITLGRGGKKKECSGHKGEVEKEGGRVGSKGGPDVKETKTHIWKSETSTRINVQVGKKPGGGKKGKCGAGAKSGGVQSEDKGEGKGGRESWTAKKMGIKEEQGGKRLPKGEDRRKKVNTRRKIKKDPKYSIKGSLGRRISLTLKISELVNQGKRKRGGGDHWLHTGKKRGLKLQKPDERGAGA